MFFLDQYRKHQEGNKTRRTYAHHQDPKTSLSNPCEVGRFRPFWLNFTTISPIQPTMLYSGTPNRRSRHRTNIHIHSRYLAYLKHELPESQKARSDPYFHVSYDVFYNIQRYRL